MEKRTQRRKTQRARAARTVIVPAFPEIVKAEEKCRLCLLASRDPEFLHRVHAMWKEGLGVRALENETAPMWAKRGEPQLDHRSFDRHFKKHVNFSEVTTVVGEMLAEDFALPPPPPMRDDAAAVVMLTVRESTPVREPPKLVLPPSVLELAQPRPEDVAAGAADYFDMDNVIRRLRLRMEQVDQDTSFVDGDGRVNSYGIVIWLRLISELRQALESLNRMRNSDRLTKAILQAHTKRFAQLLSAPLVGRFEEVLTGLRSGAPALAIADLEKLAKEDAKAIVLRAAEESVRESCEVYKLH